MSFDHTEDIVTKLITLETYDPQSVEEDLNILYAEEDKTSLFVLNVLLFGALSDAELEQKTRQEITAAIKENVRIANLPRPSSSPERTSEAKNFSQQNDQASEHSIPLRLKVDEVFQTMMHETALAGECPIPACSSDEQYKTRQTIREHLQQIFPLITPKSMETATQILLVFIKKYGTHHKDTASSHQHSTMPFRLFPTMKNPDLLLYRGLYLRLFLCYNFEIIEISLPSQHAVSVVQPLTSSQSPESAPSSTPTQLSTPARSPASGPARSFASTSAQSPTSTPAQSPSSTPPQSPESGAAQSFVSIPPQSPASGPRTSLRPPASGTATPPMSPLSLAPLLDEEPPPELSLPPYPPAQSEFEHFLRQLIHHKNDAILIEVTQELDAAMKKLQQLQKGEDDTFHLKTIGRCCYALYYTSSSEGYPEPLLLRIQEIAQIAKRQDNSKLWHRLHRKKGSRVLPIADEITTAYDKEHAFFKQDITGCLSAFNASTPPALVQRISHPKSFLGEKLTKHYLLPSTQCFVKEAQQRQALEMAQQCQSQQLHGIFCHTRHLIEEEKQQRKILEQDQDFQRQQLHRGKCLDEETQQRKFLEKDQLTTRKHLCRLIQLEQRTCKQEKQHRRILEENQQWQREQLLFERCSTEEEHYRKMLKQDQKAARESLHCIFGIPLPTTEKCTVKTEEKQLRQKLEKQQKLYREAIHIFFTIFEIERQLNASNPVVSRHDLVASLANTVDFYVDAVLKQQQDIEDIEALWQGLEDVATPHFCIIPSSLSCLRSLIIDLLEDENEKIQQQALIILMKLLFPYEDPEKSCMLFAEVFVKSFKVTHPIGDDAIIPQRKATEKRIHTLLEDILQHTMLLQSNQNVKRSNSKVSIAHDIQETYLIKVHDMASLRYYCHKVIPTSLIEIESVKRNIERDQAHFVEQEKTQNPEDDVALLFELLNNGKEPVDMEVVHFLSSIYQQRLQKLLDTISHMESLSKIASFLSLTEHQDASEKIYSVFTRLQEEFEDRLQGELKATNKFSMNLRRQLIQDVDELLSITNLSIAALHQHQQDVSEILLTATPACCIKTRLQECFNRNFFT